MQEYMAFDERDNPIMLQYPIDVYHDWYFQPFVWRLYDDLHKVIPDPNKYVWLDFDNVKDIMIKNPYLAKVIQKRPELSWVKDKIDIDSIALLSPYSQDSYEEPLEDLEEDDIFDEFEKSKLNIWQAEKDIE